MFQTTVQALVRSLGQSHVVAPIFGFNLGAAAKLLLKQSCIVSTGPSNVIYVFCLASNSLSSYLVVVKCFHASACDEVDRCKDS